MKKLKKILAVLMVLIMVLSFAACSQEKPATDTEKEVKETEKETKETEKEVEKPAEPEKLMMATTTSTADTGLLDYLAPLFLEDTNIKLEWTSVGTGEALKMGENGDVDIVLVHSKKSEEEFVANGFGVERFPVMYNDYVLIGPKDLIAEGKDIGAAFKEATEKQVPFINRGDDSGTDKKEKSIWEKINIDPKTNPNYIESGQGMGATITMANEKKALVLSDRGTFLKMKTDSTVALELDVVCEGDENLFNQYGVIAVNPEKYPDTKIDLANKFIEWIRSEKVQALIAEYGVDKYGQALFVPNANEGE